MSYSERTIRSIQDLLVALEEDNNGYGNSIWYRGQQRAEWKLLPGFVRTETPRSEGTLLMRFKQSAGMLVDQRPQGRFDWLFLMQHYGVPTRLLDWSESPLVALHFAVEADGGRDAHDAALWVLRPCELNKNARINNQEEEGYIPSFDDEELATYSIESLAQNRRVQLLPVAAIATRNNPRLQAQLGVFTIHHHDKVPIDEVGDGSHIIKYTIPAASKAEIMKQLRLLGFNRFQLFPELASIGTIIAEGVQ